MTQGEDITARKAELSEAKRALLEQRLRGKALSSEHKLQARPSDTPAYLSFGQQRLWFISKLNPENSAYNMHTTVRIRGSLDSPRLQQAINKVIARHEILRSSFGLLDSRPVQKIAPEFTIPLTVVDLQKEEDALGSALRLCRDTARMPFDLAEAPLLRPQLLKLGNEDHIFHLTVHHILFDEWSSQLFWEELAAFYEHGTNGSVPSVPELPIQYADYAAWQRQIVADGSTEAQQAYWRDQLSGDLPLLRLPMDHARPAVSSQRGALESIEIDEHTFAKLKALSRQAGATMFTTLLAAFNLLLHHLSGQDDILVGTPVANRDRYETEKLIGFFLNTLVIRTDLAGRPSFEELLLQVREKTVGALANADAPFEMIVRDLHPDRQPGQNPLFQVMFVYQNQQDLIYRLPGLDLQEIEIDAQNAKFDLTLFIGETEKNLAATFEYDADLFDPGTIRRWLGHLQTLLEKITQDPSLRIQQLTLLNDVERETLLSGWNNTAVDYPDIARIHDWIESHAVDRPDMPAVQFEGQQLTYQELNERGNRLAHRLQALGVLPDQLVAIFMERSLEMIVALLGVLKAGGAYVPLDPAYPKERLAFLMEDCQAAVVLAQSHLADRLPETGPRVLVMDAAGTGLDDQPASNPRPRAAPGNLAYLIYTSGSTGAPKGVGIRHQNLVHSNAARFDYYPEQPGRFLLLSSISFDSSVVGIYWSLCSGGTLVLPRQGQEQSVSELVDLIRSERVTHLLTLPSLYKLILEYAEPGSLRSLSTVIVAGEACPADLPPLHFSSLPQTALYNEYGPTEGTVWSTAYRLDPDAAAGPVPIGRPIPNMRVYILDEEREPAPIGVAGEIYIAGLGVAQGYWNRPELTSERFFPDPFFEQGASQMYRTGDLGRFRPDGTIEFLGRVDNQIKIRGHRVELDEIAAALSDHPAIREAVVIPALEQPTAPLDQDDIESDWLAEELGALAPASAEKLLAEIENLSPEEIAAILAANL